jgi:polyphosphate kinase
MFRRVEVFFPIGSKKLQNRILRDLELYLSDNSHAWLLQADGHYRRAERTDAQEPVQAQTQLLNELQG